MTTSESKFFLQNESIRIDSHNESNKIDSNRELECSNPHRQRDATKLLSGSVKLNWTQRLDPC